MRIRPCVLAIGVLLAFNAYAAAPQGAPAGSTGLCNDGTYYSGAEKKGACHGHKGVKEWWGETAPTKGEAKAEAKAPPAAKTTAPPAPAAQPAVTKAAAPPAQPAAAPASAAAPAPAAPAAAASAKAATPKPASTPAAGGGGGKVWANDETKVYHCPGDRWYGKTKKGEYLTEADATAKGFKPDHGKACQ